MQGMIGFCVAAITYPYVFLKGEPCHVDVIKPSCSDANALAC